MGRTMQVNGLRTGSHTQKILICQHCSLCLCLFRKINPDLDLVLDNHLHPSSTPRLLVRTVLVSKWLGLLCILWGCLQLPGVIWYKCASSSKLQLCTSTSCCVHMRLCVMMALGNVEFWNFGDTTTNLKKKNKRGKAMHLGTIWLHCPLSLF